VVEGPAGIGKSRLLAALREAAADLGLRCCRPAVAAELEFPFGVAAALFEPALADEARRGRWLDGPPRPPAAGVLAAGRAGDEGRGASFAALHGLFWLTANAAADAPLALVVDDLHWWTRPPAVPGVSHAPPRGLPVLAVGTALGRAGADLPGRGDRPEPSAIAVRPDR
jgi:hypothetical protein